MSSQAADDRETLSGPAERASIRSLLLVAGGAMLLALLVALPPLVREGGDPTTLLRGGSAAASRSAIEEDFTDPVLTNDYGHDGQIFYVLAVDFPHLDAATDDVDQIRYRSRRILFPALASVAPDGAPTVWLMFGLNLLSVGAVAAAVAQLAKRMGAPPAIGLVAGVTPALLDSVQGSLADSLALALALWGVVIWRRHVGWAAVLFLLAALARETTLVAPLACMVVGTWRQRMVLLAPFVGYLSWFAVVALWLPPDRSRDRFEAAFAWPFASWFRLGLTADGVVLATAFIVISLVASWRLREVFPEISLWLLADISLLVLSDTQVMLRPLNASRIVPLALPAFALCLWSHGRFGSARPAARTDSASASPRVSASP